MTTPRLGRVQLRIMKVLWERGRASAREITELLNRDERIAHSTVQTLLRKLEAKGAVAHDVEERVFVFRPLAKQDKVTKGATRDLIDRVFAGSASGLISYLLRNERVRPAELEQIKRLIDEKRKD
jgi:BlaI family transcriptional regulator, penicillinase repressor